MIASNIEDSFSDLFDVYLEPREWLKLSPRDVSQLPIVAMIILKGNVETARDVERIESMVGSYIEDIETTPCSGVQVEELTMQLREDVYVELQMLAYSLIHDDSSKCLEFKEYCREFYKASIVVDALVEIGLMTEGDNTPLLNQNIMPIFANGNYVGRAARLATLRNKLYGFIEKINDDAADFLQDSEATKEMLKTVNSLSIEFDNTLRSREEYFNFSEWRDAVQNVYDLFNETWKSYESAYMALPIPRICSYAIEFVENFANQDYFSQEMDNVDATGQSISLIKRSVNRDEMSAAKAIEILRAKIAELNDMAHQQDMSSINAPIP